MTLSRKWSLIGRNVATISHGVDICLLKKICILIFTKLLRFLGFKITFDCLIGTVPSHLAYLPLLAHFYHFDIFFYNLICSAKFYL